MSDTPREDAIAAESDEWKGAVGALANIGDFVTNGKASLTTEDVSNLKAMLALDLSLIGKAFAALAAEADRGTED